MSHLDIAIAKVDAFFHTDWLIKYSFNLEEGDIPNLTESRSLFEKDLIDFENIIFDNLNFSVLKGEYISDEDLLKKLISLLGAFQNSYVNINAPSDTVQEIIYEYINRLIESITLAINYYSEFTLSVFNKIKLSSKEYIFKYHEGIRHVHDEKDWKDKQDNLFLFQLNISVAEHDHNLSVNENQISNLFYIANLLAKAPATKPYSGLIKKKCEYLRNKLLLRIRHEKEHAQIFSLVDGKERQVLIIDLKDGLFDNWLNYIDSHYELSDSSKSIIELDFEELRNINISKATFLQLHRLIKYYKDIDKSLSASNKLLNEIRLEIYSRWTKAKDNPAKPFDICSTSIALNYAINNEFSFACDNIESDKDEVKNLYDEVISIQIRTGIKNFFPQTKYLKFLLTKLENIYNNHEALDSILPCRIIIDQCHEIIKSYETNVTWTEKNYNYVFQLPFKECCKEINDSNVDLLFISSSFLLPLPKDKYIKEFQDYKNRFLQVESSIIVLENISQSIKKVDTMRDKVDADLTVFRNEATSVKDSIKDKEVKMMEMLGIFTALISFVAASLPTFRLFKTPLEAALFVFALGTSFSSFVFLLIISLKGLNKIKQYAKELFVALLIVSGIWTTLIFVSYLKPIKSFIKEKDDADEKDKDKSSVSTINTIVINKDTVATNVHLTVDTTGKITATDTTAK